MVYHPSGCSCLNHCTRQTNALTSGEVLSKETENCNITDAYFKKTGPHKLVTDVKLESW